MSELSELRSILFATSSASGGGSLFQQQFMNGLPVRTNIIHRNGWAGGTHVFGGAKNTMIQIPDNEITTYWSIVDECRSFRYLDFTERVLALLTTDIRNLIDDDRPIMALKGNHPKESLDRALRVLERHKVRSIVKENINEIVYYGSVTSVCKLMERNHKKQLVFFDLKNPYSAIIRDCGGKISYLLPGSVDMELAEKNIIYMGAADFKLKAPEADFIPIITSGIDPKDPTYINTGASLSLEASEATYHAAKPLFYSITQKIKQYNVKDLLSTILSLRDAIQPTILTLNEEISRNGGDTSQFNNAAQNLESLINRLSDTSISIAELLEIDVLVNAVFSSIKVLPDPGGTLQGLNTLNLEEFKDKLNRLKDGIDEVKKDILESIGLPADLWEGSSNSNEVYQKNERLMDVVFDKLQVVKSATRHFIYTILSKVAPELNIKEEDILLRMFRKSQVEYARDQREITSLKDGLQTLSETLSAAGEVIESNRFTDKEKYYKHLYDNLSNISPDYGELIIPPGDVRLKIDLEDDDDKY